MTNFYYCAIVRLYPTHDSHSKLLAYVLLIGHHTWSIQEMSHVAFSHSFVARCQWQLLFRLHSEDRRKVALESFNDRIKFE